MALGFGKADRRRGLRRTVRYAGWSTGDRGRRLRLCDGRNGRRDQDNQRTQTRSGPAHPPPLAPPGAVKVTRPSVPQYDAATAYRFQIRAELLGALASVGPDPDSCPDRRPAPRALAVDPHGLGAGANGRKWRHDRVLGGR